jgi:DNA repair protein RecN (Recombination protein N)
MLNQLAIRNYAIVEYLQMDFSPGMSAITGETGAGKSIILGALGLTLGDRGDKDSVASGAAKADITAQFDLRDLASATDWLTENELLSEAEPDICILRRIVASDGRSKAWVNGCPVTLQQLKIIGEMLIDIHSQHEHQSLLNRATHLRLLDDFAGQQPQAQKLRQLHRQWKDKQQQLEQLNAQAETVRAQHQLVRYQLEELQELALQTGELDSLQQEYLQLNNADTTLATAQQLLDLCSENEEQNILGAINQALAMVQGLPAIPPGLLITTELLNNAAIQIEEAVSELSRNIDGFEANPQRLEEINQRLADIQALARKHRVKPEELGELQINLQEQLQGALNNEEAAANLHKAEDALRREYLQLAATLSKLRRSAALRLASGINQQLTELGMANAKLEVEITPLDPRSPTPHGLESIEFLVSTNPGQAPKPLIKIASGGELSRISLAIQVITAKTSVIPTLVFDEVDVGIGGGVAKSVGRLLRELGEHGQVLSVTHQALVAAQAHQHLFVSKVAGKDSKGEAVVTTQIRELNEQERIQEIARMLGGEADTGFSKESLAHAQELVRC